MASVPKFLKLFFNLGDSTTNDILGAYPARVHVPAMPERRYLHTTRIMTIASVLSMCGTMVLASILFLLPPQVSVSPRFMVMNKYDSTIDPIGGFVTRASARDFMMEKLIYDYVMLRTQVVPDMEVMSERLRAGSLLDIMSLRLPYREEMSRFLADVKKYGMRRDVNVLWIRKLADNVWRVRYETTDTYNDREKPEVHSWYATVVAYANRDGLSKEEQMINPIGFRVASYTVSKSPERPDDAERFVFQE